MHKNYDLVYKAFKKEFNIEPCFYTWDELKKISPEYTKRLYHYYWYERR